MSEELRQAIVALLDALTNDDTHSGGLLTRATIRKADELRILMLRTRTEEAPSD